MPKETETNPISLITKLMGEILKESCNTSLDDQIKYVELLNSKMLNAPVFHAIIQSLKELKTIKSKPGMYEAFNWILYKDNEPPAYIESYIVYDSNADITTCEWYEGENFENCSQGIWLNEDGIEKTDVIYWAKKPVLKI